MTIREIREALGYTQADMAQALGVDNSTIHRWESGKASPKSKLVKSAVARLEKSAKSAAIKTHND